MPSKKSATISSFKGSSLSLSGQNTENSGKSMHAIADSITKKDSRIDAYAKTSSLDDPFAMGHHGGQHAGQRVWNVNSKLLDFDDKFKAASKPKQK